MSAAQDPSVPRDVTLDQLKKQARRLLRALQDGDDEARAQLSDHHPRSIGPDDAKLTDAQLVLARSLGFDSWPKLRRHLLGRDLRRAIWDRDLEAARTAVDAEADVLNEPGPHPRWGGDPTPLQVAAERGDTAILRWLLDRGADVDERGSYGWTPLQLAAHWSHDEAVRLLRERGAEVDIFAACLLDDVGQVRRQLAADPSLATTPGLEQAPPLHVARSAEVARLLLDAGAPLDTVDAMGCAPLTSLLMRGAVDAATLLLERGAAATPCELAALGDVEALARRLQEDGTASGFVGPIGVNAVRGTPLHAAVHHGHERVVSLLIEAGADVNARCDMGQRPLHMGPTPAIARRLLAAGADPAAVDDEHGTTPLVWARVGIDIHGETPARRELVQLLEEATPA